MYAARRLDTVELLLDRGADPNHADRFGDTPLIVACAKGYDGLAGLLLKRGANPALRNQEGTLQSAVCETVREQAATKGYEFKK